MQNVRFRSVDEFLDYLPENELKVVEKLRRVVLDCVPGIREKLSYNVPYYEMNKGMFFIWPASVLWGQKQTYEGVRFGFQQGYLLTDETGFLEKGTRTQVFWHTFKTAGEIDIALLRTYIFEAVVIDEQAKKTNKKKR